MVRAAIIGLGWWGKVLVNSVWNKSDAIRFVAGLTRSRAKAEDFCREKNIVLRDKLDEILADPQIDALVLATPHSQHAEQIKQAAKAGKHVFVEKPFTLDVKSAKAALAAAAKAKIVVGIDFQRRFHPSIAEIRQRVRDGRLGAIGFCEAEFTAPAGLFLPKESWRINPEETPAGAMTGVGVHLVDCFIDFFGEIKEVYCMNARRAAPHSDDTTVVLMRFKNGVIASIHGSIATAANYRVAVYGSRGLAEAVNPGLDIFRFVPAPEGPSSQPSALQPEIIETKGFDMVRAALEAFAHAIRSKTPFPIPPEQIVHGVAAFVAIVRSAKTHRPVKVS
ncbi:MAG: Gfo/Idh/MocA family oxidoreductase [Xanthobacteraceae bacterium]|nr:Gfo/Idh/MocA family oxidoreductase [Xanthobacteraceae bacterium]